LGVAPAGPASRKPDATLRDRGPIERTESEGIAAVSAGQRAPELAGIPPGPGRIFLRPRITAIGCIVVLAALGWIYLAITVAGAAANHGNASALGPGMGVFDRVVPQDSIGRALLAALCRPSFATGPGTGLVDLALVLIMWCAMALAMMLPTAASMIVTYAQIAETAWLKGETVVSPHVLAVGYVSVWIVYACAATLLQWGLARAALLDPALVPVSGLFSGAVFLLAGSYQFSALKHACVTRCQRPLPFFFANWTARPAAVFRLGLRQGLYCLGCCWALMLVVFAVGVMNVVWMALLGVIMTAEKVATTTRVSRVLGVIFFAIGMSFIAASLIAHWPRPAM